MKRSSRIGPVFLTTVFLATASATYMLRDLWSVQDPGRLIVMPPQTVDLQVPKKAPTYPPLERAPGPAVCAPELPNGTDKAELWLYGERYLGWEALAEVDLDEYSSADLHGWLREDRQLYDWGDSMDTGYFGYDE